MRKKRFVVLTPPFSKFQLFYDFEQHGFLRCYIRDWIDYCTLTQIFLSSCYDMTNFRRAPSVKSYLDYLENNNLKPLIIDCGGNIGLATRYFLQTYPYSTLVCIEPSFENIEQAKLNNPSSVVFIKGAIGPKKSRARIFDPKMGNDAMQVRLDASGSVQVVTIQEVIDIFHSREVKPFIVKIDIEGFEKQLFSENLDWIVEVPIIIIELHDWLFSREANSRNFLIAISQHDRDFIFVGENVFSISNSLLS
jgi:FkbM family methyltransferase